MLLYANEPAPLYKQLYHQLRKQIENGDYQVGESFLRCGAWPLTAASVG